MARERGLEPLAEIILAQRTRNVAEQARRFVSAEVPTPEEALAGACDIVAERMNTLERLHQSYNHESMRITLPMRSLMPLKKTRTFSFCSGLSVS